MSTDDTSPEAAKVNDPDIGTARISRFDQAAGIAILSMPDSAKEILVAEGYATRRGYVAAQSCRARLIGVNPTVYSDTLSGRRGDAGTALEWLDKWHAVEIPGIGKLPRLDSAEVLGIKEEE